MWKWTRRGVQQLHAIYCISVHSPFSDTFIDLFSPFLQNVSPLFAALYFALYWDTIDTSVFSLLDFFNISFYRAFLHISSLEFVYQVLFFLSCQCSFSLITSPPSAIATWSNPQSPYYVTSLSTVPKVLDHVCAVSMQGYVRPSNVFLQICHIKCHLLHLLLACAEKVGHIFLSTCFSSVLVYFSSTNLSPFLPSILCLQCQSSVKHPGFSPKCFPEKMDESCSSKERCKSCKVEEDRWWLESKTILPIFRNWGCSKRSHGIIGLLAEVKFLELILE